MMCDAGRVVNGLISYADAEVMPKLNTTGKFLMGTALILARDKIEYVVDSLVENSFVEMLGVVDEKGDIDVDALINAMKGSADKYGKVVMDIDYIGRLTFSSMDFEKLHSYMN